MQCVCERGSSPEGTWSKGKAGMGKWLLRWERKADLPLMSLGRQDSLEDRRRANDGAAKKIVMRQLLTKKGGGGKGENID